MTDAEFVQQIETCTLPTEAFTHRNHVRLAWLYLTDRAGGDPDLRIAETIQRYASSIGKATKFDHALTLKWMRRVESAIAETSSATFDEFLEQHPELLSKSSNSK